MFDSICAPHVTRHTSKRYSSSCHTRVNMGASIFFTAAMIHAFRSTRSHGNGGNIFVYVAQNARCTVTTDLLVWYSKTQNNFSPRAAIFSLHTLTSPSSRMWTTMKNNLVGKKFLSCSFDLYRFHKYLSYGFPIINFCNPGVLYEMSCISNIHFTLQLCLSLANLLGQWKNVALILIQPINISSVANITHENLVKMPLKYNMKISFK